jgi:single-strand DNA-binding protein
MSSNGSTPITVVGNLTEDPELRFTPSGVAVAKFSVAVNRRTYDRQTNEWTDAGTDYHRVTAWRQMAENVAETLTKGMRVIVVGDLKSHSWTDTKTNEKRSGWEVDATAVGPELAFATAKVTKTARRDGAGAAPDDPWATASRTRPTPAAAGAAPAGAGAGAGGYSDEPPF